MKKYINYIVFNTHIKTESEKLLVIYLFIFYQGSSYKNSHKTQRNRERERGINEGHGTQRN